MCSALMRFTSHLETRTNDTNNFALDEAADVDLVYIGQHGQCFVQLGIELGANVLAF